MKTVIAALLIVLVVSHSEALKCKCGGKRRCPSPTETCSGPNPVCASITFTGAHPSYFRGCYNRDACRMVTTSPVATGSCCNTNLCN